MTSVVNSNSINEEVNATINSLPDVDKWDRDKRYLFIFSNDNYYSSYASKLLKQSDYYEYANNLLKENGQIVVVDEAFFIGFIKKIIDASNSDCKSKTGIIMNELIAFKACLSSIVMKLYTMELIDIVENKKKYQNYTRIFLAYKFVFGIVAKIRNINGWVDDANTKTAGSAVDCNCVFNHFNLHFNNTKVDTVVKQKTMLAYVTSKVSSFTSSITDYLTSNPPPSLTQPTLNPILLFNSKQDNSKQDNSKQDNSKQDNSKQDNSNVIFFFQKEKYTTVDDVLGGVRKITGSSTIYLEDVIKKTNVINPFFNKTYTKITPGLSYGFYFNKTIINVTTGIITQPSKVNGYPDIVAYLYDKIELIDKFGGKRKSRRNKKSKSDLKKDPKKDPKNNTKRPPENPSVDLKLIIYSLNNQSPRPNNKCFIEIKHFYMLNLFTYLYDQNL